VRQSCLRGPYLTHIFRRMLQCIRRIADPDDSFLHVYGIGEDGITARLQSFALAILRSQH
jgi:hypothetical protein